MARRVGPFCYDCRSSVRSMVEHRATKKHQAARTAVRSSGPGGSHAYTPPPILPRSDADYDRYLEERALAALPPSIDDVFPVEIRDPLPAPAPAERGYHPDPCERCGKTFRTDAGAAWHRANNRDCERWQRKNRAA